MTYTVVLVRDEDGGYCVHVPALKGCHTQGDDLPEALRMAVEAIECHIGALYDLGEPVPRDVKRCSVDVGHIREASIFKVSVQSPILEHEAAAGA